MEALTLRPGSAARGRDPASNRPKKGRQHKGSSAGAAVLGCADTQAECTCVVEAGGKPNIESPKGYAAQNKICRKSREAAER
eukprot:11564576-Heterocapsa_arctica.AAC.1